MLTLSPLATSARIPRFSEFPATVCDDDKSWQARTFPQAIETGTKGDGHEPQKLKKNITSFSINFFSLTTSAIEISDLFNPSPFTQYHFSIEENQISILSYYANSFCLFMSCFCFDPNILGFHQDLSRESNLIPNLKVAFHVFYLCFSFLRKTSLEPQHVF